MPNQLVLHIQPEEGIFVTICCQGPRRPDALGQRRHELLICDYFGVQPSTGYERLLHDCMIGDATLSSAPTCRGRLVRRQSVLDVLGKRCAEKLPNYASGTWGPRKPTTCWKRWRGGDSRDDSRRRYWRHPCTTRVFPDSKRSPDGRCGRSCFQPETRRPSVDSNRRLSPPCLVGSRNAGDQLSLPSRLALGQRTSPRRSLINDLECECVGIASLENDLSWSLNRWTEPGPHTRLGSKPEFAVSIPGKHAFRSDRQVIV